MHTVFALAGPTPALGWALVERARRVTRALAPDLGGEVVEAAAPLPELGGGWFTRCPTGGAAAELVTRVDDADLLVLAFGVVFGAPGGAAARIAAAFRAGGATAARALDGDFAAVVVERGTARLTALCDGIGHRALRCFTDGELFAVASHELALAATGRLPIALDPVSASSAIAVEWSLGGASLVRGVETAGADRVARWSRGELALDRAPPFDFAARVDRRDRRAVAAVVDRMVEQARDTVRRLVGDAPAVRADLTSGMDSRAALAALISVVDPRLVTAATSGGPDGAEVPTAARVARAAGVRFETLLPTPPSPDDFLAHLRALAFAMNGDTDGRRAIAPLPRFAPRVPKLNGGGGGLYKGSLYRWRADAARLSPAAARALLHRRIARRLGRHPLRSPELAREVLARLDALLAGFGALSGQGSDHLDLYYLTERHGRWGAMPSRFTWYHPMLSPFDSPELVRLAFTLPPPSSNDCVLHRELVRRHLPAAYWEPVNHAAYLPLMGGHPLKRLGNDLLLVTQAPHYARRLLAGLRGGGRAKSHDAVRSELLGALLRGGLAERLQAADGVGRELFAGPVLAGFLAEHASGARSHLDRIGLLACMDEHLAMLRAARALALAPE